MSNLKSPSTTFLLQWLSLRWRKRILHPLYSRLYRDTAGSGERTLLVAGTGRSGTTWIAGLLAAQMHARLMFEPFDRRHVAALWPFAYFHYARPEDPEPELATYCHALFSGHIRHPRIDRQVAVLRPRARIVKAIRANLLLDWLHHHFPSVRQVLILRHPCAVVASRLYLNWATDGDLQPMLQQPAFVSDYLEPFYDFIAAAGSPAAKHAIIWCIHNLVALQHNGDGDRAVIYYETLCTEPETAVPALFAAIGEPFTSTVFRQLQLASRTSTLQSAIMNGTPALDRWRQTLSAQQINDVLAVVRAFGLDHLYGPSPLPLTPTLPEPSPRNSRI